MSAFHNSSQNKSFKTDSHTVKTLKHMLAFKNKPMISVLIQLSHLIGSILHLLIQDKNSVTAV